MRSMVTALGGVTLLFWATGAALGHTTLTAVEPADGAELDAPPARIEMRFEHEVRLTSVVLLDEGASKRKLEFTPHGSAEAYRVDHPDLLRGRNEIEWKALSSDGHVIRGTLTYFVRAVPADTD